LRADVIELPHHGADTPAARALVASLDPMVVLQSTGASRFARDRWHEVMGDRLRRVTARDGAAWVEIDERGVMRAGGWTE
jgi:beta-lactamase superfamily II metal-dependent hydrolase